MLPCPDAAPEVPRVIRPATVADFDRFFDLVQQAFNAPPAARDRARTEFEPDRTRILEEAGRIVAGLRLWPFGHFFGGRAVPAAGIASVAVAAEARGKGYGAALMREVLAEQRAAGMPISSLYPATAPIYRACGYGFGGVRSTWKATLSDLPPRADLAVEPFDEPDLDAVDACYQEVATRTNGLLSRDRTWWERRVLRSPWDDVPSYRYLVREDDRVTGYVIYRTDKAPDDWRFVLGCRDLVWTTPGAARALLALASMHRSTAATMSWIGPPTEPIADLLPEDRIQLEGRFRWMLRLLDVPGALEARGYPRAVEAAVTIAARDPLFAENEGPWRVEVGGGRAKVVPGDAPDAVADVATWASLWSGLHTPDDAARLGTLQAGEDALDALRAMLAGPMPWISDFF